LKNVGKFTDFSLKTLIELSLASGYYYITFNYAGKL